MHQPQLIEADPQRITFNPQNPRKHQGTEFDRLRQSVREVGVVQLPTVRVLPAGFYEVIDGEGRVRSAQEAHRDKMWVVSFGIVNDEDALSMLQSANSVREFSFLAECRGMANMHHQGQSTESMSRKLGVSSALVGYQVGIGYFPDQIHTLIQNHATLDNVSNLRWGFQTLTALLPLRHLLPGKNDPRSNGIIGDAYDYTDVQKAVEKIIRGELTSHADIRAYVEQRRRELFEQRFNQELRTRLEDEIAASKQALEESHQQQLKGVEEQTAKRYESQVDALRKQNQELEQAYRNAVAKVAKQPDLIKEYEQRMQKKQREVEAERARWQSLQDEVKEEARKAAEREEKAQAARLSWQKTYEETQEKAIDQKVAQKLDEKDANLKAFYEQRDQQRQLKSETTVRQAVAHGTELLAETQQSFLHLTTPDFVKGIAWLPEAEIGSLLAQIIAVQDTLTAALEAIRHSYSVESEERVIAHG